MSMVGRKYQRRAVMKLTGASLTGALGASTIASAGSIDSANYRGYAYHPKNGDIRGEISASFDIGRDRLTGELNLPGSVLGDDVPETISVDAVRVRTHEPNPGDPVSNFRATDTVEDSNRTVRTKFIRTRTNITGWVINPDGIKTAIVLFGEESQIGLEKAKNHLNNMEDN